MTEKTTKTFPERIMYFCFGYVLFTSIFYGFIAWVTLEYDWINHVTEPRNYMLRVVVGVMTVIGIVIGCALASDDAKSPEQEKSTDNGAVQ